MLIHSKHGLGNSVLLLLGKVVVERNTRARATLLMRGGFQMRIVKDLLTELAKVIDCV